MFLLSGLMLTPNMQCLDFDHSIILFEVPVKEKETFPKPTEQLAKKVSPLEGTFQLNVCPLFS